MTHIEFETTDVKWINDNILHVYTKEAFDLIMAQLGDSNYILDAYVLDGALITEDTPYRFAIPDTARIKCNSCGALQSIDGCEVHGKTCTGCGLVICRELYPGCLVSFTFNTVGFNGPWAYLSVKRWDEEEGYLYLDMLPPDSLDKTMRFATIEYMVKHRDKWDTVVEDGKLVFKLQYPTLRGDDAFIRDIDIEEREIGYTNVDVWNDIEYPEDSEDPRIPRSIAIYKRW